MSIATKAGRFLFFPRIRNFKAKAAALRAYELPLTGVYMVDVTFLRPVWIYSSTLHACRYYLVGVLPAL